MNESSKTEASKTEASKIEPSELPAGWQKKDHFTVNVLWLSRTRNPGSLERDQELRQMLIDMGKPEAAAEVNGEFHFAPGWYVHASIEDWYCDTQEDAEREIKRILKNSSFASPKIADETPSKPPVHVSKSQRRELITRWRNRLEQPATISEHDEIQHNTMLEFGSDLALFVGMYNSRFEGRIGAYFKTKSNPLRSMIGTEKIVGIATSDDDTEDWQQLARGILEIHGNEVRVGTWKQTFLEDQLVYGVAFEEAWLWQHETNSTYGFHKPDMMPPDVDYEDYLDDEDEWIEDD